MNCITNKTFTGTACIGLTRNYSNTKIAIPELKKAVLKGQQMIYNQHGIGLSLKLTHTEIVFLGQDEPSMDIQLIQYPKFPQTEETLKKCFIALLKLMMLELEQNRVVVIFTDETIMLEQSDAIDPTIQF
jgi:hypothetical protein